MDARVQVVEIPFIAYQELYQAAETALSINGARKLRDRYNLPDADFFPVDGGKWIAGEDRWPWYLYLLTVGGSLLALALVIQVAF